MEHVSGTHTGTVKHDDDDDVLFLVRILEEFSTIHSLLVLFFFFEVEISSHILIPLSLCQGSVHSDSVN